MNYIVIDDKKIELSKETVENIKNNLDILSTWIIDIPKIYILNHDPEYNPKKLLRMFENIMYQFAETCITIQITINRISGLLDSNPDDIYIEWDEEDNKIHSILPVSCINQLKFSEGNESTIKNILNLIIERNKQILTDIDQNILSMRLLHNKIEVAIDNYGVNNIMINFV